MKPFQIGDRVRIAYLYDHFAHNGEIGTITWVNLYNYYPNRDESVVEKRQQGTITFANGDELNIGNLHYQGCGILSPVELVKGRGSRA